MADDETPPEDLILRDHLALDRTRLANERTLLAYIRTALMLLVAGATAVKFVGKTPSVIISGWLFIASGVLVAAFGTWRFLAIRRTINQRLE
jgi:putative membrane protein